MGVLNTTVVVCSANRPDVLSETIESLMRGQSLQPREIIVSVFNRAHVPEKIRADSAVRVVVSSRQALSAQRNAAVKVVRTPYTLFLDDDVEIAPNFIESMESLFDQVEDVVVATGFVVVDGVGGDTGVDRKSARAAVLNYVRQHEDCDAKRDMAAICLYAQECSIKFFSMKIFRCMDGWRIWTFLQIVSATGELSGTLERALLTWNSNRKNLGAEVRLFPDRQPILSVVQKRHANVDNVVFAHWLAPVARNLFRTLIRVHGIRSDRTGRFKGNMIGFRHLLAGKVDPSYILQLQEAVEWPHQVVGGNSAAVSRMT